MKLLLNSTFIMDPHWQFVNIWEQFCNLTILNWFPTFLWLMSVLCPLVLCISICLENVILFIQQNNIIILPTIIAKPSLEIITWEDFLSPKLLNLVKQLQIMPKVHQENHTFGLEVTGLVVVMFTGWAFFFYAFLYMKSYVYLFTYFFLSNNYLSLCKDITLFFLRIILYPFLEGLHSSSKLLY